MLVLRALIRYPNPMSAAAMSSVRLSRRSHASTDSTAPATSCPYAPMFCTTEAPTVPGMHALQAEVDAVVDEIIPIAAGFGVDVHDSLAVLDRRGLVGHGDLPAGVAHDDAIERPISDQQIGSAANHA